MTDLTETQRTILAAAAIRSGMRILPLPDHLKGGAVKKVIDALLARALVEETAARANEPTIRDGVTLMATAAAFRALGLAPPIDEPSVEQPTASASEPAPQVDAKPRRRDGTKQAQVIAMLQSVNGATIAEIATATAWQPHTVRGAIAGALKKRLGLEVTSDRVEARGRVYRIVS